MESRSYFITGYAAVVLLLASGRTQHHSSLGHLILLVLFISSRGDMLMKLEVLGDLLTMQSIRSNGGFVFFLVKPEFNAFFLGLFFRFLLTKTKADQATWFPDWLPLFVLGFCYFPFRQQSICAISLAPVLLLRLEPSFFFETHLRTNFFTIIKLLIGTQKYCPSWELDLLVGLRADTLFLFCCYWYQMLNNRIPKKEPRIRECQVNATFHSCV